MDYFPLFVDLRDRRCVVVGGGRLALRKAELIAKAGARITVVAPKIGERLADIANETIFRDFTAADVNDAALVIGATDDPSVNRAVSEAARKQNVPVNVVDDAELSNVIFPSIVDRSPLVIAISSGGASPVLLRQLRTRLEAMIPSSYGRLAEFAGRFRKRVADAIDDGDSRRRFWERVLAGRIGQAVLGGREGAAERLMEAAINDHDDSTRRSDAVHLLLGAMSWRKPGPHHSHLPEPSDTPLRHLACQQHPPPHDGHRSAGIVRDQWLKPSESTIDTTRRGSGR